MDDITTLVNALTRKDRIIGELEADNERLSRENSASKIRAEAAERRVAELEEGIKAIDNAVEIQCHDGNWNYDSYMHGMANGLLLAQTYMAHPVGTYDSEHYKPLSAPERWLSDS